MILKKIFLIIYAVLFVCGCTNNTEARRISEIFSLDFHQKVSQEKYDEIYNSASPEFKENVGKDKFISYMQKISSIMGPLVESEYIGLMHMKSSSGKPVISVQFNSMFKNGIASEVFVLEKNGENGLLFNYNITSDYLSSRIMTD